MTRLPDSPAARSARTCGYPEKTPSPSCGRSGGNCWTSASTSSCPTNLSRYTRHSRMPGDELNQNGRLPPRPTRWLDFSVQVQKDAKLWTFLLALLVAVRGAVVAAHRR